MKPIFSKEATSSLLFLIGSCCMEVSCSAPSPWCSASPQPRNTHIYCGLKVWKSQAKSESFFLHLCTCCCKHSKNNNNKKIYYTFSVDNATHEIFQNPTFLTLLSLCFMIKCKYIWLFF